MTPGPFLPTVLASAVLHRAGSTGHLPALAGGGAVGAVGLDAGSLVLTRSGGTATVTGTSGPVMGGPLADVLVLPAADAGGVSWVALTRDAVQVEELPSHDLTRRLARITCRDAAAPVLDIDSQAVRDLAAVLFAAEASGLADWATATAADYAKVRQQFGRPIGQFQGVKHRCARMLAQAEQARACAWDAARAQDEPRRGPASLAAAVAGATSVRGRVPDRQGLHPGARRHRLHLGARRAPVPAPRPDPARPARLHRELAAPRRPPHPGRRPPRARRRPAARGGGRPRRGPRRAGAAKALEGRERAPTSPTAATPPRTCPPPGARAPTPSTSWSSPRSCAPPGCAPTT